MFSGFICGALINIELRLLSDQRRIFLAFGFNLYNVNDAQRNNVDQAVTDTGSNFHFAKSALPASGVNNGVRFINDAPEIGSCNAFLVDKISSVIVPGGDGIFRTALQAVGNNKNRNAKRKQ